MKINNIYMIRQVRSARLSLGQHNYSILCLSFFFPAPILDASLCPENKCFIPKHCSLKHLKTDAEVCHVHLLHQKHHYRFAVVNPEVVSHTGSPAHQNCFC